MVVSNAYEPTATFLSPLVIAVPASYPIRVLSVVVPLKLSPALEPILVFLELSLISMYPSVTVTTPAETTIPALAVIIPTESTLVTSS